MIIRSHLAMVGATAIEENYDYGSHGCLDGDLLPAIWGYAADHAQD